MQNENELIKEKVVAEDITMEAKVEDLALKLSDNEDAIETLEKQLEKEKEINTAIKKDLSELMEAEGYAIGSTIVLKNGKILKVKEYFTCGIPSESKISKEKDPDQQKALIEKKEDCLSWLNINGLDGIIKNILTASFGKGENEKAKEIVTLLQDHGVLCENEITVHPSTLKSTLKEVMKAGKDVPFELFDIHNGMVVEIK